MLAYFRVIQFLASDFILELILKLDFKHIEKQI